MNSVYHVLDREFLIDLSGELLSHDDIRERDSPNMDSLMVIKKLFKILLNER